MILACLAVIMMAAQAQKVTFFSPEFELGVRQHLGLDANEDVLQSQTDTITSIDLSGLGLRDIRDVVYLSAVEELDLSYNRLQDVSPLLSLDSLRYVDVSYNLLESVSILTLAQLDSLVLDVTNNYIEDFSYFFTPTLCWFTLVGMDLQLVKDAPYFDVYTFYASISEEGHPMVTYRGYTNMGSPTFVECKGMRKPAQFDGETYTLAAPGSPYKVAMVRLTNDQCSDTTWVLPAKNQVALPGQTLRIATDLPAEFSIGSVFARNGYATIDGNTICYTVADAFVADTIYFSYFHENELRGYSLCYIVSSGALPGDANNDGVVDVADTIILIDAILGKEPEGFNSANADINQDGDIDASDVVLLIQAILDT